MNFRDLCDGESTEAAKAYLACLQLLPSHNQPTTPQGILNDYWQWSKEWRDFKKLPLKVQEMRQVQLPPSVKILGSWGHYAHNFLTLLRVAVDEPESPCTGEDVNDFEYELQQRGFLGEMPEPEEPNTPDDDYARPFTDADIANQQFHKQADAEIDLMERIHAHCTPDFLSQTDAAIAAALEQEFGIPANLILDQFNADYHCDFTTSELVWKAREAWIQS